MRIFKIGYIALTFLLFSSASIGLKKVNHPRMPYDQKQRTELELAFSFPGEELENKDYYLAGPRFMEADELGNIYITDQQLNRVMKFSEKGEFLAQLGRAGQGPGEMQTPLDLIVTHDYILIKEIPRFQFFDLRGNYLKSFIDFKGYYKIALRKDGSIFALPILKGENKKLVDVLSPEGKIISSFGDRLKFNIDIFALNYSDIEVYENTVYIAFKHFPIVRKYSDEGELINEFRISYGLMSEMGKNNMNSYRAHLRGKRPLFKSIIENIEVTENRLYLLHVDKALEILECDHKGNIKGVYWYPRPNTYYVNDFLVKEEAKNKTFYLLQVSPESKIDVFRPKTLK